MNRCAVCLAATGMVVLLGACAGEQANVAAFPREREDRVLTERLEAFMKAEEAKNKPTQGEALKYNLDSAARSLDKPLKIRLQAIRAEIKKVTPGMTRRDLFKVFTIEGGLQSIDPETVVYGTCGCIKVDVKLKKAEAAPDEQDVFGNPADIITEISKPYLQWEFID